MKMVKRIALVIVALLAVGAILLALWYRIDGQPLPETAQYLAGEGFAAVKEDDGSFVFTPIAANGHGLVIMHGALIKPQSYAQTAAYFAQLGYTVFVPSGPGRLSVNAVDSAAARLDSFGVQDWFFIGHSMGGYSSLELISRHQPNVRAVALWAAGVPADFSGLNLPMLYIWGDNDGLQPLERFAEGQANLPESVHYVTLPGANHKNFAMYSHQYFDNDAILDPQLQIDFANDTTAVFFAQHF
jgi:pimeloyl-ACP methyl ester carboxylesterase